MKPEFITCDQGTPEWQGLKLGVISASNISKVLAKKGTETRNTYMMELIGQIATQQFDEINARSLEHGKVNEPAARAAFDFETGLKVSQIGFIYGKDKRFGCSPDGIMMSERKGLELKCPVTSKVHADFLCNDKVKPEYQYQVQFSLYCSQFDEWFFASFHPSFKTNMLKIKSFEKDLKVFERFDNELPEFITEMDEKLRTIGLSFGDQWK